MFGAIIGDVVGSRFEFNNIKTTEFELFDKDSEFSDDTVCTIALMDWLLNADKRTSDSATEYLHTWVRKYPNAGYGVRFYQWMKSCNPQPYESYGNGAAMRISSIAWVAKDLKELKELSDIATGITHNHPEGLKGALVVATCIFMAIHNSSKDEIRKYAISQYPEIESMDYSNLVKTFTFNETCQGTVPQAIYCFLISSNFEDCIRKTISIGGDCDTTAAMSGAIAEAYWGIPERILVRARDYINADMIKIVDRFYSHYVYQYGNSVKMSRFRKAQEKTFDRVVQELKNGKKESHWMWYMFPQIKGLGESEMSEYYGLCGFKDASLYYSDEVLYPRLVKLCEILINLTEKDIKKILGTPDDKKLKSCMTLFYLLTRDKCFKEVLDKYFDGELDHYTMIYAINQILKR